MRRNINLQTRRWDISINTVRLTQNYYCFLKSDRFTKKIHQKTDYLLRTTYWGILYINEFILM